MIAASSEMSSATVWLPAGAARAASADSARDGGCGLEHLVGEGDEALVLRDEVGLGVELEDRDLAVTLDRGDEAFARRAVGALGVALRALQAQDLDGLLEVAVGLLERLLGVDHAGAELLAQGLDVGDREVCHGWRLLGCEFSWMPRRDRRMPLGHVRPRRDGILQDEPACG